MCGSLVVATAWPDQQLYVYDIEMKSLSIFGGKTPSDWQFVGGFCGRLGGFLMPEFNWQFWAVFITRAQEPRWAVCATPGLF